VPSEKTARRRRGKDKEDQDFVPDIDAGTNDDEEWNSATDSDVGEYGEFYPPCLNSPK